MITFAAGDVPSAGDLNDAVQVGQIVLDVTATADSNTWNSATKVLTNLVGTFINNVAGAKYEIDATATVTKTDAGAGYGTLGLTFNPGGACTGSETPIVSVTDRESESGAAYGMKLSGQFTASSTGTYGVACVGWIALGSGILKLDGDANYAINRIKVTRSG